MTDLSVRVTRPDGSVVTGDGTNTPAPIRSRPMRKAPSRSTYIIRLGTRAEYLVEILGPDGSALAETSFTDSGAFVKNIGTSFRNTVREQLDHRDGPGGGVAGGNSIIVGLQVGSSAGAIACSDPKNGAVQHRRHHGGRDLADRDRLEAATSSPWSAETLITCTYSLFSGATRSSPPTEFSGLSATPLDQIAVGASSSRRRDQHGLPRPRPRKPTRSSWGCST